MLPTTGALQFFFLVGALVPSIADVTSGMLINASAAAAVGLVVGWHARSSTVPRIRSADATA